MKRFIGNYSALLKKFVFDLLKQLHIVIGKNYNYVKNDPQVIISLLSLFVAIYAIKLAKDTSESSDRQFKANLKNSDSLFRIQLSSEKLNSKAVESNLSKIHEKIEKQTDITDMQLETSKMLLQYQIKIGQPKIVYSNIEISENDPIVILITYQNTGVRDAFDIQFRCFATSRDFSDIKSNIEYPQTKTICEAQSTKMTDFRPKLNKDKSNFFFCIEISYLDTLSKIRHFNCTYMELKKSIFLGLNDLAKNSLKDSVNSFLKTHNHIQLHD